MPITFDRETIKKHPFFKDGKEEGLKEGLEKAKREDVINLHQATGWDAKKIAEVLKLPLDFVEEAIKNYKA